MALPLQKDTLNAPVIPGINQEQLGKLLVFKDKKARYRKNYIAWDNIERANPPEGVTEKTKHLSAAAGNVLAAIIPRLERGERVIFNHKYLSTITKRERRQNINIIEQLKTVLDIIYHNSVAHKGKKYRYSYEFRYKVQTQENSSSTEISVEQKITQQNYPLYIDNKNNLIKDIDLESNFLKNSEEGKEPQTVEAKVYQFNQHKTPKKLADFHPLSQEDCTMLQSLSGRKFNLNAMNEILLDMSKRRTDPFFYSKNGFMSYMGKAFRYEKRDANKINNETFRIARNLSSDDRNEREVEKYLSKIEECRDGSQESHLKKKLGVALNKFKAVELLKSYDSLSIMDGIAKLKLYKTVDLSSTEKEIILQQIREIYEVLKDDIFHSIHKLELITPQKQTNKPITPNVKYSDQIPDTLMGKIRKQLIAIYGGDGEALDISWFSQLDTTEDNNTKEIDITSSKNFIFEYIKSNYEHQIERIAETMEVKVKWRGVRW